MNKLEAFKKYVWFKQWYYAGEPKVADSYYDQYEQHCRDLFPGDDDFYMAGYGQAHEDRLKELQGDS